MTMKVMCGLKNCFGGRLYPGCFGRAFNDAMQGRKEKGTDAEPDKKKNLEGTSTRAFEEEYEG